MSDQVNKLHPALKHGGYSATSVLPGEDRADFEKLHQDLIAEFNPVGALEHDIVATVARLLWRKRNLATFRIAELVKVLEFQISHGLYDRHEHDVAMQSAVDEVRKEIGAAYELTQIGDTATVQCFLRDLKIEDRLDAMVDKCLKRLLFVRGLKSISGSASTPQQRITDHTKAA